MKYRKDKYGNDISALGYGCMRFPQTLGKINKEKTEQQIMLAISNGINYFDTAYIYPGSEAAVGEIFEKNGILMMATLHPAALLRNPNQKPAAFEDFLKLREKIDELQLDITKEY